MYYYAVLSTKDVVEYISEEESEVTHYDYIPLSTPDQTLVGKWYDREGVYGTVGAFLEPPISIQAEHSSSQISYKGQDVWLDEKLDSYATQSDLSNGLAGKANVSHFHDTATQTSDGYISSGDKAKLDGIEANANLYVHPDTHAASMITGLSDVATSGSYDDLSDKPTSMTPTAHTHVQSEITGLETALSGKASSTHTHAQSDITGLATALSGKSDTSHTHTAASTSVAGFMSAADKTKLNGIAANANAYTHPSSHPMSMITGLLDVLLTDSYGGVKNEYTSGDMLNIAKNWAKGMYTAYFKGGSVTNTPTDKESWRCIAHKTGALFGWLLAFGTSGSVYNNYLDNGTWRGWRNIYDANPSPLWTGKLYMSGSESSPQTVTPSKKLSECRTGYLLVWSDYDPDTSTANDADFVTTFIPKKNPTGGNWSGKSFLCDIPRYIGSNVNDVDTERRIMKIIYVYDNCIKGNVNNNKDERNDVVLRCIWEI